MSYTMKMLCLVEHDLEWLCKESAAIPSLSPEFPLPPMIRFLWWMHGMAERDNLVRLITAIFEMIIVRARSTWHA
jgi:hypothetical protein